jgi:hypothetical protein
MDSSYEIRRRRLQQLCAAEGGVRAVADRASLSWQALNQVIKGVPLPVKQDGTRSPRSLGDAQVRALEAAYGLGPGWFDWPFEMVDFSKWQRLDSFQRVWVMGQLSALLDEAAKQRVPDSIKAAPASDKRVAEAYKKKPKKKNDKEHA